VKDLAETAWQAGRGEMLRCAQHDAGQVLVPWRIQTRRPAASALLRCGLSFFLGLRETLPACSSTTFLRRGSCHVAQLFHPGLSQPVKKQARVAHQHRRAVAGYRGRPHRVSDNRPASHEGRLPRPARPDLPRRPHDCGKPGAGDLGLVARPARAGAGSRLSPGTTRRPRRRRVGRRAGGRQGLSRVAPVRRPRLLRPLHLSPHRGRPVGLAGPAGRHPQ